MSFLLSIFTVVLVIGLMVLVHAATHAPEGTESEEGFAFKAKSKGQRLGPIADGALKSTAARAPRISAA